jgi:hypothetical protein
MLTMAHFQYHTFVCEQSELQAELTKFGLEGWRLHTCDPVVTVGSQGSGLLSAFVVMDKFIDDEEEEDPSQVGDDDAQEGIAMKG